MEIAEIILNFVTIGLLLTLIFGKNSKKPHATAQTILMSDGKIDEKALSASNLTIDTLIEKARLAGYFNLGDIDTAVLEKSGAVSFLPKPAGRALNPKDFNFTPVREGMPLEVIRDGKIIEKNFESAEFDRDEIMSLILSRGRKLENIILATITDSGRVDIFEK